MDIESNTSLNNRLTGMLSLCVSKSATNGLHALTHTHTHTHTGTHTQTHTLVHERINYAE
jgi:hypothetical protein